MRAAASKRWGIAYRNRLTDWVDKWLFFIAFVVGASGIVALKSWQVPQGITTAFPLVIMLCYACYVFVSQRYRLREDMAGDSLYYLGFLYTLTSLAYALYAFTHEDGNTQVILSNFGIALATTIVGMALRVLFDQMRMDPVEIEREAHMELTEAVAKLKGEIDHTVLELNSFRRATLQSIDEGHKEMQAKVSQALTHSTAQYDQMAQAIVHNMTEIQRKVETTLTASAARFADVGTEIGGKIQAAFAELAQYPTILHESAKKTAATTKRLIERIEQMELSPDVFTAKFTPAIEHVLAGIQHITEGYTQTYALHLQELLTSMHQAAEGANTQTAHLARLQEMLDNTAQSAQSLRAHLNTWHVKDEQRATVIERELALLQQTLALFRGEAEQNGQLLRKLSQEAEAELGTIREHRQALDAEVRTSRALVGEMHTALVSMASLVVEQLHGR